MFASSWHQMTPIDRWAEFFQKANMYFCLENDIYLRHMSGKMIYFSDLNFWKSLANGTFQTIVNPVMREGKLSLGMI